MAWLQINPGFAESLSRHALTSPRAFLALPGVVLCGHPDRHVVQVQLDGLGTVFLKKEHRVRWKDRLHHFLEGLGWCSKSAREAKLLRQGRELGIGCPDVIAVGEDGGQAFVLLKATPAAVELRSFLRQPSQDSRRLAVVLAKELARLHSAGFGHQGLFAKHLLVGTAHPSTITILDWQRARRYQRLPDSVRWHDLATLDATLAEDLAGEHLRLLFLRSYWRECGLQTDLAVMAPIIRGLSRRLQQRPRIREQLQAPLPAGRQNLIWLDGERLCVTREFREEFGAAPPRWLKPTRTMPTQRLRRQRIAVTEGRTLSLVSQWVRRPWRGVWAWLRRRSLPSPAFVQAAAIFRLERYGVPLPRLLAVGQDFPRPWQAVSFLLTEPLQPHQRWLDFLLDQRPSQQRWQVLRQAGELLRRIHAGEYRLAAAHHFPLDHWAVHRHVDGTLQPVLTSVEGLRRAKRFDPLPDLRTMFGYLLLACSRTEMLRFLQGYFGARNVPGSIQRRLLPGLNSRVGRASA